MPTPNFLKRTLCALFFVLLASPVWASTVRLSLRYNNEVGEGTWDIGTSGWTWLGGLSWEIKHDDVSRRTFSLPDAAQGDFLRYRKGDTVDLRVRYAAGSLHLKGLMTGRDSADGTYAFEPDGEFAAEASRILGNPVSNGDLMDFAMEGVSLEFISAAARAGVSASANELLDLRHHGLHANALTSYAAAGFKRPRDLIELQDHGVSANFAQDARNAGYGRDARELIQLHDHGVAGDTLQAWAKSGFTITADEVIRAHEHGVPAEYASVWKKSGFNLTVDEVIRAREHGVPSDFIREIGASGAAANVEDVIKLREQGVSAAYVKRVAENRRDLSTEEMVKLRQQGVEPEFYTEVIKTNPRFSVNDVIRLQQHGVPASYVKALNVEGRTPLDADTLIDLRNRGIPPELARKLRE